MKSATKYTLLTISLAILSACGGGENDDNTINPSPAEGFWRGSTSTGYNTAIVVLENGEIWGIYTSGETVNGALYGTSSVKGNIFSAAGYDFNLTQWAVFQSTLEGVVVPQSTIRVTSKNGTTANLNYYQGYNTPATQAAIAGSYTVKAISAKGRADNVTMTISNTGVLSLPGVGCSADGKVTPRASGKNVYDITVRFTGNSCALGNGSTASGIFILDGTTAVSLALIPSKQDGFIGFGIKNS